MTSLAANTISSELLNLNTLSSGTRAYFRARLRNRLYDLIATKFAEQKKKGLTKAQLARRMGKKPEVITRLLSAPGNWGIDTISDLLLAIDALELSAESEGIIKNTLEEIRQPKTLLSYSPNDKSSTILTSARIVLEHA